MVPHISTIGNLRGFFSGALGHVDICELTELTLLMCCSLFHPLRQPHGGRQKPGKKDLGRAIPRLGETQRAKAHDAKPGSAKHPTRKASEP